MDVPGSPGYRPLLPLVFRECDVVVVCSSPEQEEEVEDVVPHLPHLPLLHVLTKQDQGGPSLMSKVGVPTSALTGHNVEMIFLMCSSLASRAKVRPNTLQLQLSLPTSPQQSADIRPSRLYSQNKSNKILAKLTPVQPPLSPATESLLSPASQYSSCTSPAHPEAAHFTPHIEEYPTKNRGRKCRIM